MEYTEMSENDGFEMFSKLGQSKREHVFVVRWWGKGACKRARARPGREE